MKEIDTWFNEFMDNHDSEIHSMFQPGLRPDSLISGEVYEYVLRNMQDVINSFDRATLSGPRRDLVVDIRNKLDEWNNERD